MFKQLAVLLKENTVLPLPLCKNELRKEKITKILKITKIEIRTKIRRKFKKIGGKTLSSKTENPDSVREEREMCYHKITF